MIKTKFEIIFVASFWSVLGSTVNTVKGQGSYKAEPSIIYHCYFSGFVSF